MTLLHCGLPGKSIFKLCPRTELVRFIFDQNLRLVKSVVRQMLAVFMIGRNRKTKTTGKEPCSLLSSIYKLKSDKGFNLDKMKLCLGFK